MIIATLHDCPIGSSVFDMSATAAGTTQATATPLVGLTSIVTTVPPGSGVQIARPARYRQIVVNAGANALNVWPRPGMALAPSATDTAISLQPGRSLGLVVQGDEIAFVVFNSTSFG